MKKSIIISLVTLFTTLISYGQEIRKSSLYGTWESFWSSPGRTIQKHDSIFISIPPITHSITKIQLKRFSRVVITTKGFNGIGGNSKFKGKWKISGDTLLINLHHDMQMYLIDQSIKNRIFLNNLNQKNGSFRRKN